MPTSLLPEHVLGASVALQRHREAKNKPPPNDWRDWLTTCFPEHTTFRFAPHHEEFWNWIWAIRKDQTQRPFVAIWPRAGAKSTSVEMGLAGLAARGARRYALYCSASGVRANDHVSSVARMFESEEFTRFYPQVASKAVRAFGNQLGWRQNRLRTASGFAFDAIGLDVAVRCIKLYQNGPAVII